MGEEDCRQSDGRTDEGSRYYLGRCMDTLRARLDKCTLMLLALSAPKTSLVLMAGTTSRAKCPGRALEVGPRWTQMERTSAGKVPVQIRDMPLGIRREAFDQRPGAKLDVHRML